jgi:hypothetical protein
MNSFILCTVSNIGYLLALRCDWMSETWSSCPAEMKEIHEILLTTINLKTSWIFLDSFFNREMQNARSFITLRRNLMNVSLQGVKEFVNNKYGLRQTCIAYWSLITMRLNTFLKISFCQDGLQRFTGLYRRK